MLVSSMVALIVQAIKILDNYNILQETGKGCHDFVISFDVILYELLF